MSVTDYAYVETTSYCNLACSYCNRGEVVDTPTHMPLFRVSEVIRKLGSGIREVKLMGMGEPYMHPHFSKICGMFRNSFPDAFIISSTNGQHTAFRAVEESLLYLSMLYISIDGVGETFERFRTPAKWPKMISFLEKVSKMDRGNCKIAINFTINSENVRQIDEVNRLVEEFNFDELRLNYVQNWNEGENNDLIGGFTTDDINYVKNWKHLLKGRPEWDFRDCFWVQRGAYITANGEIKVCCMNTSTKPIANIFSIDEFDDVRSKPEYQSIRIGCEQNNPSTHCQGCSYKELTPLIKHTLT